MNYIYRVSILGLFLSIINVLFFYFQLLYLGFLVRFILAYKPFELQSNINEIVNIDKETQDMRLKEEEEKCNATIHESIQRNNMNGMKFFLYIIHSN